MPIHLITFASPRFRHRQHLLGWSAMANKVVTSVTHWTPKKVRAAKFVDRCPAIKLSERGSGFYAWKPFIIQKKLEEAPEGHIVFYCDVGRTFPYKLLYGSLQVFLDWMRCHGQAVMPGVQIPWNGPMAMWTKRDAFVAMSMDSPFAHSSAPIQASFSIWVNSPESRGIVAEWMDCCANRQLISDDSSVLGLPELSYFKEHRHDQSLFSLICLNRGIRGIDIGQNQPVFDSKHPSEVGEFLSQEKSKASPVGVGLERIAYIFEKIEAVARWRCKMQKNANLNFLF